MWVDTGRMLDARDSVEVGGAKASGATPERPNGGFLRLWFKCSGQYARANKTADGAAYVGRCPKCGATARFPIGPGGTSVRVFEMSCR